MPYWKEAQPWLNPGPGEAMAYILVATAQLSPDGDILPDSPLRGAQAFIYDDLHEKLFYVECNY